MSEQPTQPTTDESPQAPTHEDVAEPMPMPTPTSTYQPPVTEPYVEAPQRRPGPQGPTGPSIPTVLWGLVLALVAAAAIVHQVSDVDLDLDLAIPLVVLGAGASLVIWGLAGVLRRRA